jgi:hypothetical protein
MTTRVTEVGLREEGGMNLGGVERGDWLSDRDGDSRGFETGGSEDAFRCRA